MKNRIIILAVLLVGSLTFSYSELVLDPIYCTVVERPGQYHGFYASWVEQDLQKLDGANVITHDLPWIPAPATDTEFGVGVDPAAVKYFKDYIQLTKDLDLSMVSHIGARNQSWYQHYPEWFFIKFPEVAMLDQNREIVQNNDQIKSRWPGFDRPVIVKGTQEYINAITSIDNEGKVKYWTMGGEQMYPTYFFPSRWTDYNEITLIHFREWLKLKYYDLEKLNYLWRTSYVSWKEIEPPVNMMEKNLKVLDWLLFREDNMSENFEFQYQEIIKNDTKTPILAPVHGTVYKDYMRALLGMDLSDYAANSDGFETGQIIVDSDPDYFNLMYFEFLNAFQKPVSPGRMAYRKTDPSAQGGGTSYTPKAARRYIYEAIGMGAWHIGLVQWKGVTHDGTWGIKGTQAEKEIKKIFGEIEEMSPYLDHMVPVLPEVGIYVSNIQWLLYGWESIWTELHRRLIPEHIAKNFLTDYTLRERIVKRYPVIINIENSIVDSSKARELIEYVKSGGTMITDEKFTLFDEFLHPVEENLFKEAETIETSENYEVMKLGLGKIYKLKKISNDFMKANIITQLLKELVEQEMVITNLNKYGGYIETFDISDGNNHALVLINIGRRTGKIAIKMTSNRQFKSLLGTSKINRSGESFEIELQPGASDVLYVKGDPKISDIEIAGSNEFANYLKAYVSNPSVLQEKKAAIIERFSNWLNISVDYKVVDKTLEISLNVEKINGQPTAQKCLIKGELELRPFAGFINFEFNDASYTLKIPLNSLRKQYDYFNQKYITKKLPLKALITLWNDDYFGQTMFVINEKWK